MGFELFCATMLALLFGMVVCFGGYRLFLSLLPIWGFFFGFALGATSLQALFGIGFLATVTSWVVGFLVGALFAVLSYMFYTFAVATMAASVGYALGAGFMNLIGLDWNWLVWLVGILAGAAAIVVTFYFSIQKYVIVAATAIGGAGMIVITLMFGYIGMTLTRFFENPIRLALNDSPLWAVFFLLLAAAGIAVQLATTRTYVVEAYETRVDW
jgi:hypothetical protein